MKRLQSGLIDQPLCTQMREAISGGCPKLSSKSTATATTTAADFDRKGTEVWNLVSRSGQEDQGNTSKVLPLLQCFALLLLGTSASASSVKVTAKVPTTVRILRISLQAASTCIRSSELELATDVLQTAADYAAWLENICHTDRTRSNDPANVTARDLVAEYWLLRSTLSWKQGRLDLSEIHFNRAKESMSLGKSVSIYIADVAFEIGKDLVKQSNASEGIPWFEQALNALEQIPYDEFESDACDLRLSIAREFARASIMENTDASRSKAADLISYIESEQGIKLGVLLLKTDLLWSTGTPESAQYQIIISQMIHKVVLNHSTFKAVLVQIKKLQGLSATLARRSLEVFITSRLLDHGETLFIEKAVILLIWICSMQSAEEVDLRGLQHTLESCYSSLSSSFSEEATHAAQSLCWKSIDLSLQARLFEDAEKWCRIARSVLFANAGDGNNIKLARKLMLISLSAGKTSVAREAYHQMPQSGQMSAYSQYLLYRVALSDGDNDLAEQCLGCLLQASDADADLLCACAHEAQKSASRLHVLQVLRTVLQKSKSTTVTGLDKAVLLRCMIQMLITELTSDDGKMESHLQEISGLFKAASSIEWPADDNKDSTVLEVEWFAMATYNAVIQYIAVIDAALTLDMVESCLSLTKLLDNMQQGQDKERLRCRLSTCHYLAASCCAALARSEDHKVSAERYYTCLLKHVSSFTEVVADMLDVVEDNEEQTANASRSSQLLRLEIEALFKLQQLDLLDQRLENCVQQVAGDHLELLADLVMSIHSVMLEQHTESHHLARIPTIMQNIVNQSWRKSQGDMTKLARWLRCVFRMTSKSDPETALRIVEQASHMVASGGLRRVCPPSRATCCFY